MSGTGDLPVVPGSSDHPDHDLLADLAAEVLSDDLAEQVQGHVVDCADCAGLLAEAEGIRTWLRRGEPEVMPADVMERLALALAEVSPSTHDPVGSLPTPAGGVARTGTDSRRRLTPALPKNKVSTGDTGRLTRITSRVGPPGQSARRQAREEELADRPSLLSRLAPALKAAAVVVVLLGVGGFLWTMVGHSSNRTNTAASDSSAGTAASAPVLAPVQTSGTNYSAADLKKQVDSLIGSSQKEAFKSSAASTVAPERAQDNSTLAAGSSDLLTSPTALRACLTAIGAQDDQPVAVDLARWDDRDAAIIVLNADGGGYDVWVVSRSCAPNADGTIAQEHIDS